MGHDIAIVGTGISGLGAAWALSTDHNLTVYESTDRIGGHTNTVEVDTPQGPVPVDTGFIVYNEVTYPNLTRLFDALDVPTQASDMSFAFSVDREFEYAASMAGVLSAPRNLRKARFLKMLLDINRFRRTGARHEARNDETIGELLSRHGYSAGFLTDYLFPMTGAIWSTSLDEINQFPARTILSFLHNHGLIEIAGRPTWRSVRGGSREYLRRVTNGFEHKIRLASPVTRVTRALGRVIVESKGESRVFDQVILATHSDQALQILGEEATQQERSALAAIRYQPNLAILHSDPRLMPANRRVWSSWNAMTTQSEAKVSSASVTYWMNRLQSLKTDLPLFVSLNPLREPDPALIHGTFRYAHPQFDVGAVKAQEALTRVQGLNNTWFAGAYLGYGFHEDGLQSGLNVAAALGSPAPWHGTFEQVSSAASVVDLGAAA
ncbi:MAG: FAD-dependent oxidoreductase [Acidimicrobiia bacterium]